MRSFRQLKGVLNSLLGIFMSRNNDIGGYWGPGVLYRETLSSEKRVKLDLLVGAATPGTALAKSASAQLAERLDQLLRKEKSSISQLSRAEIEVEFEKSGVGPVPAWAWRGEPFLCTVTLADGRGHLYSSSEIGRCEPHDPAREQRRGGPG